jgi:hypothetical protein
MNGMMLVRNRFKNLITWFSVLPGMVVVFLLRTNSIFRGRIYPGKRLLFFIAFSCFTKRNGNSLLLRFPCFDFSADILAYYF